MKNILVSTDFSANAFTAAKYAAALANERNWQMEICHAFWPFYSGFQSDRQNQLDKEQAQKEAFQKMTSFVEKIQQIYSQLNIQGTCLIGQVQKIIPQEAEKNKAVLIVMGTQGVSGLKSRLLGSNTFAVIQKSEVPVLAVPRGIRKFSFQRVGFAINYHATEIVALQDLVDIMNGALEIMPFHLYIGKKKSEELRMDAWMSKINKMITHSLLPYKLSPVRNFASGILHFIKKEKLDALVMTRIDKCLLVRVFKRDLAEAIAFQPPVPVLFIKEK